MVCFLLYKSTKEIHEKIDHAGDRNKKAQHKAANTMARILVQIILIDAIFSVDSILTAVGMTTGVNGALWIMIIAVCGFYFGYDDVRTSCYPLCSQTPIVTNLSAFLSYLNWIYAHYRRGAIWRNLKFWDRALALFQKATYTSLLPFRCSWSS